MEEVCFSQRRAETKCSHLRARGEHSFTTENGRETNLNGVV